VPFIIEQEKNYVLIFISRNTIIMNIKECKIRPPGVGTTPFLVIHDPMYLVVNAYTCGLDNIIKIMAE
jgi:hypothetical protein